MSDLPTSRAHGGARSGVSLESVPLPAQLSPGQHPRKKVNPAQRAGNYMLPGEFPCRRDSEANTQDLNNCDLCQGIETKLEPGPIWEQEPFWEAPPCPCMPRAMVKGSSCCGSTWALLGLQRSTCAKAIKSPVLPG